MRHLWLLFLLLPVSLQMSAQQPQVSDLTNLSIEELAQTTLSSASRHLEDPRKAPAKVTVITREEILRFGWRTLGELLRSVPEFYTAYDRDYTYVGVRGFLQSGDYNARVLLLIDGHRVNENVYDSGMIGSEFPLDLNLIDHVEVACGPGSSLFGTNAELAVVNVFTRRPEARPAIEVETEAGSFLGRAGEVIASFRGVDANAIVSGSLFRSNGADQLFFPDYDSPASNWGIARNLDGDRFDHAFAAMRHGEFRVEGLWGRRTKIIPNAPYGTNFNDPGSRSLDTRGYVDVAYSHSLGSGTELDLRGYYDNYRYFGSFPYGGTNSPDRSVQINDAFADWIGLEGVVSQKFGQQRLVAGLAGEYNLRVLQRNYYLGQSPFLDDHRHPDLQAGFAETELTPWPWLSLNLGGRIDHYNTFGSAASPRIALMVFPGSRTSVKYILGRAFRAPDPYDQYYVDDVDIQVSSPRLQPEHTEAQTVLVEHRISDGVHVEAEVFQSDLRRTIEEAEDPISGLTHFTNEPGERSRGADIDVNARSAAGWAVRGSLSSVRTKSLASSTQVINSPSSLAKLDGTAPLARYAHLGLELLYTGPQRDYQGSRVASSFLANATVSAVSSRTGWDFSVSCYNLLNRHWATPTGPEISEPATVQDGRTWRVRLQYRYSLDRGRRHQP